MGIIKGVVSVREVLQVIEVSTWGYTTTDFHVMTPEGRVLYATKPFRFLEDTSEKDYFKKVDGEQGFKCGAQPNVNQSS